MQLAYVRILAHLKVHERTTHTTSLQLYWSPTRTTSRPLGEACSWACCACQSWCCRRGCGAGTPWGGGANGRVQSPLTTRAFALCRRPPLGLGPAPWGLAIGLQTASHWALFVSLAQTTARQITPLLSGRGALFRSHAPAAPPPGTLCWYGFTMSMYGSMRAVHESPKKRACKPTSTRAVGSVITREHSRDTVRVVGAMCLVRCGGTTTCTSAQ